MAQATGSKQYFTFVGGLNTEASPLTFPENTSVDETNFVLNIDGSRQRRKGMDFEEGYQWWAFTLLSSSVNRQPDIFYWRNVNGDASLNFIGVKYATTVMFYLDDGGTTALSANEVGGVSLGSFQAPGSTVNDIINGHIETAYGKGRLFIVGKHVKPIYLEYDSTTETISATEITLRERDTEGVESTSDIGDRPSALTAAHMYNLLNQGWTEGLVSSFYSARTEYPALKDIPHLGYYMDPSSGKEKWDAGEVVRHSYGSTPAAKGAFIRDVFDTSQSFSFTADADIDSWSYLGSGVTRVTTVGSHGLSNGDSVVISGNEWRRDLSGVDDCSSTAPESMDGTYTASNVTSTTFEISYTATKICSKTSNGTVQYTVENPEGIQEDYRPAAVAFFAGRVWYAGVPSDRLGSRVYYSQIIQTETEFGKCYQNNDPTSREISDLLATDGGMVSIPEIGQVHRMLVVGTNLALFADNGVWLIAGGESEYFTATSFSVRKLTEVGVVSPKSVVLVEGTPMFASRQGIYILEQDKISGYLSPRSISETTVQSLYRDIPDRQKAMISGFYDDVNKKVYWLYADSDQDYDYTYNKILVLDIRLNAFYTYSFPNETGVYIMGGVSTLNYDNQDNKNRFLVGTVADGGTFATLSNDSFLDWYTHDGIGVDAAAYIVTGYELADNAMLAKQAPYVMCYFNRTEQSVTEDVNGDLQFDNPSSCLMQARWEWANHSDSGKYSSKQEVYRLKRLYVPSGAGEFNDGYPVVVTKNKVRGKGKAISLKFETQEGKDCQLLGWGIAFASNTRV